ncbi:MAG: DUF721 domain-containing protein [Bacteroidales bacterium]|jgi:hypothetical protein|nr:DUF721 domain-containing protein [Bacteroidales bacterium]
MERQEPKLLKDLLPQLIQESGWQTGLLHADILDAWDRVVDEAVRLATVRKYVKNHILYCHISSSALRFMIQGSLDYYCKKINQIVGLGTIKKIVLR